jgi:hypothetical protein
MKEESRKYPFVLEKSSGTVPKHRIEDNRLLNLNNKIREQLNKLKQGR